MSENPGGKILIVDDEPANIFFLEGLLEEEGYKVFTASDGKECMDILNEKLPDVILLDIMMPGITGIQVLERIVKNEETRNIPVIMVTAKTEAEDVELALDKGAFDYIRKPIDEIELLARVKSALRYKFHDDSLREMLKSKEEFVNLISQDLRDPFTSISGFAEMLYYDEKLSDVLNNEQKKFLKYIINSANYTVEYFNKLLNWTNLGHRDIRLRYTDIDLSSFITICAIIFETKMNEKEINFRNLIPKDTIIKADEIYFGQVIRNIISNAVKFTSNNGVISVEYKEEDAKKKIIISDTGVGIRNKTPEELFGRALNVPTRGTKGETGTGLGLGICKKIIDAHGFQITFESEVNEGTSFIITI